MNIMLNVVQSFQTKRLSLFAQRHATAYQHRSRYAGKLQDSFSPSCLFVRHLSMMMNSADETLTEAKTTSIVSLLKNPSLLLPPTCFDNSSIDTNSSSSFSVHDPAVPSRCLGHVPNMESTNKSELNHLVQQAHHHGYNMLWNPHSGTTALHRASLLQDWSRLIQSHQDDLSLIITCESGKPLAESRAELKYATSFLDYYAAAITCHATGSILPTPFSTTSSTSNMPMPFGHVWMWKQPVSSIALAMTPWNFPAAMLTRKVGPALAAGSTAIIKPSPETPFTAWALVRLAHEVGIPPSVLTCLTTDEFNTPSVVEYLILEQDGLIDKISFTGSTRVGKHLLSLSAQSKYSMPRLSLELGGNAPFIVLENCDGNDSSFIKSIVIPSLLESKFRNAGQACVASDRFLVHSSLVDEFISQLCKALETKVIVGHGLDPATTMGPLISSRAVTNIDTKVQEALDDGATLVWKGQIPSLSQDEEQGYFYPPTVLFFASDPRKHRIWSQETFGPVISIHPFDTLDEALTLANDVSMGLASYVCTPPSTASLPHVHNLVQELESGIVGINTGVFTASVVPFGGMKQSGMGKEGSLLGLEDYLETKYVHLGGRT